MDIIDIILASKKSFTGETETLIRQAKEAMAQANEVAAILEDAQEANAAAQEANEAAVAAQQRSDDIASQLESMKEDVTSAVATMVSDEIDEALTPVNNSISALESNVQANSSQLNSQSTAITALQNTVNNNSNVTVEDANTSSAKVRQINVKQGGTTNTYVLEKNYTDIGNNEDGSMTQKAIKDYVSNIKVEIENNVQEIINNIDIDFSGKKFSIDDAGNIIIIGEDGSPTAGSTSEADIIAALIRAGLYDVDGVVGLQIDYANKTFTRIQEASGRIQGHDFDPYVMYGGRMRCNVADNGTITAFYGDYNYREDGSNGQVMVYQPKFYYQRTPITYVKLAQGNSVKKETLILSDKKKSGFKLHPMFINEDGEEIDYVLLPAYEGSIYDGSNNSYDLTSTLIIDSVNDKLSSIAGAKPITGDKNEFTITMAERLARNRGEGWHITNMAAESVNQMLMMVEFGSLNGQKSLEQGIVTIPNVEGKNCASLTGSTSEFGNETGVAYTTRNETNGVYTNYSLAGRRAITYRGMENPWGNVWHFIGGLNVYGQGRDEGGYPYICNSFNYNVDEMTENYDNIGFKLPGAHSWISGMGYGDGNYDWVYMPSECSSANSALPVGDNLWTNPILNGIDCAVVGGTWESEDSAGPFYYGCDRATNYYKYSFGAKLMFIPKKNTIYTQNITKWESKMAG